MRKSTSSRRTVPDALSGRDGLPFPLLRGAPSAPSLRAKTEMTLSMIAFVSIVLLALLWAVLAFNRLVRLRNQARTAWADIDVQLTRRHDLVPQLVAAVQGYASHEGAVLEAVTTLRSQAVALTSPARLGEVEAALEQALGRLFALKEAYPDLKASANFIQLQGELTNTEDRIAAARRFFNGNVRALNTRVATFPSNLIASMFGFHRRDFFELTDPAARTVPSVDL